MQLVLYPTGPLQTDTSPSYPEGLRVLMELWIIDAFQAPRKEILHSSFIHIYQFSVWSSPVIVGTWQGMLGYQYCELYKSS